MTKLRWMLTFGCALAGLVLAADSWKTKPGAQWSEGDARQVLTDSPWAKKVTAGIARRLGEDELRESGQIGQPHGVGYDGIDPKDDGTRFPQVYRISSPRETATVSALLCAA